MLLLQLDLYNQRILEKREQQYKEMLARKKAEKKKDSTLTPPGINILNYTLNLTGNISSSAVRKVMFSAC